MASLQEVQQQLMASHEQVRLLSQEVASITQRLQATITEFDRKANYLNNQVSTLQQSNAQLLANGGGGGAKPSAGLGQLVNLKTMQPKIFTGKDSDPFRSWAKKVRSYCNAAQPGFKKFLK